MLAGTFNYHGHIYNVKAYDFEENIAVYLSATLVKDKLFIDQGISLSDERVPPNWDELYVSIGAGNMAVDCYTEKDSETGQVVKNQINREVLARFSEILRGMKNNCDRQHRDDLDELDLNSAGGFYPNKILTYVFEGKGYMKLDMLTITEVKYDYEGVSLYLEEDGDYTEKIYKHTDTTHKCKLYLDEFNTQISDDNDWDFGDDKIFSLAEIIEKNPHKSYAWLKGRKYKIVSDLKEVEEICKKIWKHKGIVAFDTETTGLKVNITSRQGIGDRLVGLVFSIKPGEAWYFPVAHKKIKNICTLSNEHYIITKYFKPLLEQKDLICHNGAYDWKVMYNYGIFLHLVHDLLVLFHVTYWNDHRNLKLNLKNLTSRFLNRDSFELSDFVSGKFGENNVKFWDLEEESVKYYACPDTDNLIELFQYVMQEGWLDKYGAKKIYEIEVAFSIVIAYQEYYGHCVDVAKIDDLVKAITHDKDQSYKEMVKIVGHDFNPRSTKDLQKVFFEEQGYPVIERTEKGNPSTGKDTRKQWASEKNPDGSPKYPLAKLLQTYSDAATLESNFTKNIDKFATDEGLMFSEVKQFLETGRVSVKEPNYQSYSDTVKKYIIPRTGYYALDADYSSVEARIMVSMAGCQNMVDRLKDPDMDYHTAKASDMFGVPYELVSHKLRKMSKGVNFGILYGLGDRNLGANLYGEVSPTNTEKARKQKKLYYKGMEELEGFIAKSKAQGTQQNYSTTFFDRRRYYDPRKVRKDKIERQSCNARIQGTAADIYKIAMIRLLSEVRKHNLLGKVLISAFVHDECFLEVHKSIDPCKILKTLRRCMMLKIKGWCPLFIGAGFGRNWYEAKNTEIPVQVQDAMVNNWGDNGLDWWDGNNDRLYRWEKDMINDYRRDRVINYLKNEDNWGKVFSPTENSLAHEVMDEIKGGEQVHGVVTTDFEIKSDMIENLEQFCIAFGLQDLFAKADIKRPEHSHENTVSSDDEEEDFSEDEEEAAKRAFDARIRSFGVHSVRNSKGAIIYFRYDKKDPALMKQVYSVAKNHPGSAKLYAVKEDGIYDTGMSLAPARYQDLLRLYITRANIRKLGGVTA